MKLLYTQNKKLLAEDADMFRRLKLGTLFSWLQEISIAHTEALGAGRAKTLDKGFLWIVAGVKLHINRLPEYDDEITLSSWAGQTMHVLFPRYYVMRDKNGEILLKASAVWLLIDKTTRKMIFPAANGINVKHTVTGEEIPLPSNLCLSIGDNLSNLKCERFSFKPVKRDGNSLFKNDAVFKKNFTPLFNQIDLNGHLNNSEYVNIFLNTLGESFLTCFSLKNFDIEFKKEILPNKRVTMLWTVCNENNCRSDKKLIDGNANINGGISNETPAYKNESAVNNATAVKVEMCGLNKNKICFNIRADFVKNAEA